MSENNSININNKTLVAEYSEDATAFISDHGKLLRLPIKKIGGMNWREEISAVPEQAQENSVFKISENIYQSNTLVFLNDGGCDNAMFEDDNTLKVLIKRGSMLLDAVFDVWHYNRFLIAFIDGVRFEKELTDFQYDNEESADIDASLREYGSFSYKLKSSGEPDDFCKAIIGNWKYLKIIVPDENISPENEKHKKLLYAKGECIIYQNGGWKKFGSDDVEKLALELRAVESKNRIKQEELGLNISFALDSIVFEKDDNGNVICSDNCAGCKAYYIKSIDLENKKIYLSETQVVPVISTEDNTDADFETPTYEVGDSFTIVNNNHYHNCGTVASVSNNVVTYSGDSLGFTTIVEDADMSERNYTFRVYNKPDIGCVTITKYAFAQGFGNKALGCYSSAFGGDNIADGFYSHVEGRNNYAAYASHAEGNGCKAIGNESHAEGHRTKTTAGNAHAEGQDTIASGGGSHAEGMSTQAVGSQSHSEGLTTIASGAQSHAEGVGTEAQAYASHAEGNGSTASGRQAHAEGYMTVASGQSSHAEGQQSEATNSFSHAQGIRSYARGYAAFTSGADVTASGDVSAAMGKTTTASARAAMAFGESVTASGAQSAAMGHGTKATAHGQMAVGLYNEENADALFMVGNGTSSKRSNAFVVDKNGKAYAGGKELCDTTLSGIASDVFIQKAIDSGLVNYIINMLTNQEV